MGVWTAETSAFIGDFYYYGPVKILHVETGRHFLGGPQQVIYLINALRERGHDNILVCPPDSGIDMVAREHGIRSCKRGVEIGRGIIDIPEFLKTLLKIDYSGMVSLEYEKDADDPLAGPRLEGIDRAGRTSVEALVVEHEPTRLGQRREVRQEVTVIQQRP